jgi:hypothetical protein
MAIGLVNVSASVFARAVVSFVYKVPTTNAMVYNAVDMAATAGTTYVVNLLLTCYSRSGATKPEIVVHGLQAGIVAFAASRIVGICTGIFAARASHCPVPPLLAFVTSMSAVTAFLVASLVTGQPRGYQFV